MRFRHWMLPMALLAALAIGCGGPAQEPQSDSTAEVSQGASQTDGAAAQQKDPAQCVTAFLEAVRRGDDAAAAAMFTGTAREKASEMNIEVAPKGSDTARFGVGQVEYVGEDVVKVQSTWTDYDPEGELRTDEMAWMLRREPEGWRVAGMAATVFDGEPPLLLDFENPEETLRKLQLLRDEIRRRTEAESYQATQPANPDDAIRR